MTWPDCGTNAAYARHYRSGEKPCAPCRAASTAYRREWRRQGTPRELVPCGSPAAYRRHLRRGEEPCLACRAAERNKRGEWAGYEGGALSPPVRGVRNGLPETPGYRYRARRYPWAERALAAAEERWGSPEGEAAA